MLRASEELLKIAVDKYKKTNNLEVELTGEDYSHIAGLDMNLKDTLRDLAQNGMIASVSIDSINVLGEAKLFLTLDGIEYFDNPKLNDNSDIPFMQKNIYYDCNVQNVTGNNNTIIQNNQQNDMIQLRNLISDFLDTKNINNDNLQDELQSVVEDIDEGKTDKKQVARWWNRIGKISDVVSIGTAACQLLPAAQECLTMIIDCIHKMM